MTAADLVVPMGPSDAIQDAPHDWVDGVPGRSMTMCQFDWGHRGAERAHRWSRARVGPLTLANGLFLCSFHHRQSHSRTGLSYRAGWMVRTGFAPALVPALIVSVLAPGGDWHVLDDGDGLFRLAEMSEVEAAVGAGVDPELTLGAALAELAAPTPAKGAVPVAAGVTA